MAWRISRFARAAGSRRAAPWRRARCPACRSRIACRRARPAPAGSDAARRRRTSPSMVVMSRPGASQRQHQAGIDRRTVHQHRAGAAVAVAAAFLGAGQAEPVAQQIEQRVARVGEHASCSSPLTVQVSSVFMRRATSTLELPAAVGERARRQHGHQRAAIVGRAARIGDRARIAARRAGRPPRTARALGRSPTSFRSADGARIGVGADRGQHDARLRDGCRPRRAAARRPAPAMAMSISRRGVKRR